MTEGSRRLFLALWPESAVVTALDGVSSGFQRVWGGRRMAPETLHLTLAFLGDVAEGRIPALLDALDRVVGKRCHLSLDRVGYWSHNQIVWVGCTEVPALLLELVQHLQDVLDCLGLPRDHRPFFPHVTLLRRARAQLRASGLEPIPWQVMDFALIASEECSDGARYRSMRRWKLK